MTARTDSLITQWQTYPGIETLDFKSRDLLHKAKEIALKAYAPYSQFMVGAAVLLDNHQVVPGNNQENAAYPAGLCAERVAMFSASAQYPGHKIIRIAIAAYDLGRNTYVGASPCGSCRQVFLEYERNQQKPIEILFYYLQKEIVVFKKAADLLPLAFSHENLEGI